MRSVWILGPLSKSSINGSGSAARAAVNSDISAVLSFLRWKFGPLVKTDKTSRLSWLLIAKSGYISLAIQIGNIAFLLGTGLSFSSTLNIEYIYYFLHKYMCVTYVYLAVMRMNWESQWLCSCGNEGLYEW